jgi:fumarate reductase flavoprotein subunit
VVVQAEDERRRLVREVLHGSGGKERIAPIREAMQKAMEQGAGIYRTGPGLAQAADRLGELHQRARHLSLDDHSRTFNTELISALELSMMLDVARAMVQCGLAREESRGAHQRTDFPNRDDNRFLAHSLIHRNPDGSGRVEYLPVTITRWPPGERVYGR